MPYQIADLEDLTRWSELSDLPDHLPIGLEGNSNFDSNTEYIPNIMTGHHEILLGDLEDRYGYGTDKKDRYKIYSQFLPEIVRSLGNLQEIPLKTISQMYLSDVLTILLNIRIESYGEHVSLSTTCICPKQKKLGSEDECHDLSTLRLRVWTSDESPVFYYELKHPSSDCKQIMLAPPRFQDVFDADFIASELHYDTKLAILLSDIDEETYESLSRQDRTNLIFCAKEINTIGLENSIPMFCDFCGREWDSDLLLGINNPSFYLDLLTPPRLSAKGTVREYLNQQVLFLTVGDQAPFSSATDVLNLTPKDRLFYINKLHEMYEEQKRSMKQK